MHLLPKRPLLAHWKHFNFNFNLISTSISTSTSPQPLQPSTTTSTSPQPRQPQTNSNNLTLFLIYFLGIASVAMLLNTFLHSLLYMYLTGVSILFLPTRIMGFVQLLGVIGFWYTRGDCGGETWANNFALVFYFAYFMLFVWELISAPKIDMKQPKKVE